MGTKVINSILTLQDKASPKLITVSDKVKVLSKDMQRSTKQAANMSNKFASNINKMTAKALKFAAVGGILAAGIIVKVGFAGVKELDEASAKVKSIAKDALQLEEIKRELLKTSNKTGVNVTELGETQYSAISSGVKPEDSIKAAVTASKLAKAGFTDSNSALQILTSTMNVYGLEGQAAMQSISDKMLVTQNLGVTTVAELSGSLGSLTPIAQSAGLSIDELMAGMASTTKNGLKTEEAVTSLKGIMTSVISPTKEAADMASKLGIDFSVGAIKSKGFAKFLEEIKVKTGGNTETMSALFGNVRALSGALILSGKGFDDFGTSLDAMENSSGATEEAFKQMENTLGAKLGKLKNIAKNTATSIMQSQSGVIGEMVDKAAAWVDGNQAKIQAWAQSVGAAIGGIIEFARNSFDFIAKHQDVIVFLGTFFVSVFALTKAFFFVKNAINAMRLASLLLNGTLMLSPIGWVIAGFAALIAVGVLVWKNWDKIKEGAMALWTKLTEVFEGIKTGISEKFTSFIDGIKAKWSELKEFLKHPISGTVKLFKKDNESGTAAPKKARNALGTSYWKGGLTSINERGGEIIDLPSGSRVIPHDVSENITNSKSNIFNISINGVGKSTQEMVNELVPQLKLAMANI